MELTIEKISNINLDLLKHLVQEYVPYAYKSKLNKSELINILQNNLDIINIEIYSKQFFKGLVNLNRKVTMNEIDKYYYLKKGLQYEFESKFMDKKLHALKFDTIIFKTKDYDYKIIAINKNEGYEPSFDNQNFKLWVGGKYYHNFDVKYSGNIGFELNEEKGILFILTIINDYNMSSEHHGSIYYNERHSHTYEDIQKYISNKVKFEPVTKFPRGYYVGYEGTI